MLKVSRLADYAVVILATLAAKSDAQMTASAISEKARLPEPTVAKVTKLLAKDGLIDSSRGAGGGYRLTRQPHEISIAEVITAIDGPISLTTCVEGNTGVCDFAGHCSVKGRWDGVNDAIRDALESVTLSEMLARPTMLAQVQHALEASEGVA
jgi:FeS assembly SUF system regulator